MNKKASYILFEYSTLSTCTHDELLEIGNANGKPIPSFDEDLLISLCIDTKKLFEKEDIILEIDGDTIVIGDIHGSLHDLLRILKHIESTNANILFLGDYVDRRCFSLECVTLLFAYKVMYPDRFFFIRGNHEFDSMCSTYGFKKEILNYHNPKKKLKLVTNANNTSNDQNKTKTHDTQNVKSNKNDDLIYNEILCDKYYENHINMD